MFYRCSDCNKPFVALSSQKIEGYTFGFLVFVTPCCSSLNYSELSHDFLSRFVDGKQRDMVLLNNEGVKEFTLQWEKDFAKMNEKAE